MILVTIAEPPILEPAAAMFACQCYDCTHPTPGNADRRAWHSLCHAEFRELVGQEFTVPGVCRDPRCYAALPHPEHLL